MKNVLVTGAGGFIGGHLVKQLINDHHVFCVDIKELNNWYQKFDNTEKFVLDLKNQNNFPKLPKNIDYIYNLACNMGGMGFIENNKAECMLSVLINTNLLNFAKQNSIEKFFYSSSACVYAHDKQNKLGNTSLKESDAYPANPEDGYGWEKLFSERMCRHFFEDFGVNVRIARYHNVYGPFGSWDGGREKAPAALCRKFIEIKYKKKTKLEIWGDGTQLRSFMHIDDCIKGTKLLFESEYNKPINIGQSEFLSINQFVEMLENLTGLKPDRLYKIDAPKGVSCRSSDNTLCKSILKWEPNISLIDGLKETYNWIEQQYILTNNIK